MKSNYLYNLILQILLLLIPFVLFLFLLGLEIYDFFSVTYLFILFFIIILVLFATTLLIKEEKHSTIIKKYFISFVIILGLISYILNIYIVNKNEIVVVLLTYFSWGFLYIFLLFIQNYKKEVLSFNINFSISFSRFAIELLLFLCIIFFNIHFVLKTWIFPTSNILIFIFLIVSWFISLIQSDLFTSVKSYKKIKIIVYDYILTYLLLLSISYFFINVVLQSELSNFIFPITVYFIWSLIITIYRYLSIKQNNSDEVQVKLLKATTYVDILEKDKLSNGGKYKIDKDFLTDNENYRYELREKYLIEYPNVFDFINKNIELNNLTSNISLIIRSTDIYNIKIIKNDNLYFFINLHEINDLRRINEYFIELNNKIQNGGIFVGRVVPIKFRYRYFLESYPQYLSYFLYFFDFIWKRILPKLPIFKKIYFFLTKGKKRALSLSEGLGRLYYCGFEVISLEIINNYIYFIAKKVKPPSNDANPSYGPLFKMKRIGQNGKIIKVYKFRTMHPYSEYIQKFAFDLNKLQKGGKISNDFRITVWGKILRKFWLDELPMLINFFKGELKLVGVRPLSKHYLSLYPDDVKEIRIHCKPGLIPPFYVDLPKSFEEIIESEVKYIHAYEKHHFITDFRYFFLAWYNIIIKKARSA